MPYPKSTDPDFCPGSGHPVGWSVHSQPKIATCPYCDRPIARVRLGGKIHPHKKTATRISHDMGKLYRQENHA